MKRFLKGLGMLALTLSLCSAAWAFRDEPRDFNGIRWGIHFDSVSDQFRPARRQNSGGNYYYERLSRFQTWKVFDLNSLVYVFGSDGRFKEAQGSVRDGRSSFEDAVAYGTVTWGDPSYGTSNDGYRKASWFGRDVNIVFVEEYGGWRFICTRISRPAPAPQPHGPGGYAPPPPPAPRPQPGYRPMAPRPRPHSGDDRLQELRSLRGYHGIAWGTPLRDYRYEFSEVSSRDGVRLFVRQNDDKSLVGMRASAVYYCFDRAGLQSVALSFDGGNGTYNRIFEACRSLWGKENAPQHMLRRVEGGAGGWIKQDGMAFLTWDSASGTGSLILQRK